MRTWLHWIGRKYYSRARFTREAAEYGVTRRLSLATLKRMAYGDRVVLAIRDGKSGLAFAEFAIDTLSGLSEEGIAAISAAVTLTADPTDPMVGCTVDRGCGSYVVACVYTVTARLAELAAALENCKDPGKPMVGGPLAIWPDPVRLKRIPQSQGFRLFDYEAFRADVVTAKAGARSDGPVSVHGLYYAVHDLLPAVGPLRLHHVEDYQRSDARPGSTE